ncbi:MAG: hypothetical protein ABI599_07815 [Flavobacteriales bacterium]
MDTSTTPQAQLPEGTNTIVVFDTNAYRLLSETATLEQARDIGSRLRARAREHGQAVLASPIVIWELVTHLGDTADPAYAVCQRALVMLAHHTEGWVHEDHRLQPLPFGSAFVCHALYGAAAKNDTLNAEALQRMAVHARDHAPDLSDTAFTANAAEFASQMDKKEQEWLGSMKLLIEALAPANAIRIVGEGSDEEIRRRLIDLFSDTHLWPKLSQDVVEQHAATLGFAQSEADLRGRTAFMMRTFEASYRMFAGLMGKLTTPSGINVESRKRKWWNFIWDQDLCYLLGPAHVVGSCDLRLVTGDKAFKTAATAARCDDRVFKLDEYRSVIGF